MRPLRFGGGSGGGSCGRSGGGGGSDIGIGCGISWDDPLLTESLIFMFIEEVSRDLQMDLPMDGRTNPLIEMRGCI